MEAIEIGVKKLRVNPPRASAASVVSPPSHHLRSIQHRRRTIGACSSGGGGVNGVGSALTPRKNLSMSVSVNSGSNSSGAVNLDDQHLSIAAAAATVTMAADNLGVPIGNSNKVRRRVRTCSAGCSHRCNRNSVPDDANDVCNGHNDHRRAAATQQLATVHVARRAVPTDGASVESRLLTTRSSEFLDCRRTCSSHDSLLLAAAAATASPFAGSDRKRFADVFSQNMADFAALAISDGGRNDVPSKSHSGILAPSRLCHQTKAFFGIRTDEIRQDILSCSAQAAQANTTLSADVAVAMSSDDVTAEELAGYFDEMLHLPKKMSLMAEMMYT